MINDFCFIQIMGAAVFEIFASPMRVFMIQRNIYWNTKGILKFLNSVKR